MTFTQVNLNFIILIIVGDLNRRTGKRIDGDTVGQFGDVLNDNGEQLIEISEMRDLKITKSFYQETNTSGCKQQRISASLLITSLSKRTP